MEPLRWYWRQISWPNQEKEHDRGISWLEMGLDFVAATGTNLSKGHRNNITFWSAVFARLSRSLFSENKVYFPFKEARSSSLGAFGFGDGQMGFRTRPRLLCPYRVGSLLACCSLQGKKMSEFAAPFSYVVFPVKSLVSTRFVKVFGGGEEVFTASEVKARALHNVRVCIVEAFQDVG